MIEQILTDLINSAMSAAAAIGWTDIRHALLTKGDSSATLIVANGQPKEIHLRDAATGESIVAYLPPNPYVQFEDGHTEYLTIEARVGCPPGSKQLTVMDFSTLAGRQAIGTLSPQEAFNYEAWWAKLNQIVPLRGRPTDPVSKSVAVDGPIWYIKPSTNTRQYVLTLTKDLTATIAALSSGKHQLGMLYLDKEAGALSIATLTAVTAAGSLPSRSEFTQADVQGFAVVADSIESSVIYLYYGQGSLAEADFYRDWDPRPLFSASGNVASFSDFDRIMTDADGEIMVDDDGNVMVAEA